MFLFLELVNERDSWTSTQVSGGNVGDVFLGSKVFNVVGRGAVFFSEFHQVEVLLIFNNEITPTSLTAYDFMVRSKLTFTEDSFSETSTRSQNRFDPIFLLDSLIQWSEITRFELAHPIPVGSEVIYELERINFAFLSHSVSY